MIALGILNNIISSETPPELIKVIRRSDLDELVELIDSLQASLTAVRNRFEEACRSDNESEQSDQTSLQSIQTQVDEENDRASIRRAVFQAARLAQRPPPLPNRITNKIRDKVEQFQPDSPYSKWDFQIGSVVRIKNKVYIDKTLVPEQHRFGEIVYFTSRFIVVYVRYLYFDNTIQGLVSRERQNVRLVYLDRTFLPYYSEDA